MNIGELKIIINQSIEDNIMLLDGTKLDSIPVMRTLSDFFPKNMLKLEFMDGQTAIEDLHDKEGILLRGRGIEYPFLSAAMELTFYIKEDQLQFELQADYDKDFVLSDAFLPFKGTLLEKVSFSKSEYPRIRVCSESQYQGQCGMYFDGVIDVQATDNGLSNFINKKEIAVSGPVYLKENGSQIYNFEFVAAEMLSVDIGITKVQAGLKLSTNLVYNSLEEGYTIIPYIELFSELPYNSENTDKAKIPLSARIFNLESDIRLRGNIDEAINVLTRDLNFLTNGVNLSELLPSNDFYLEEQLQLKELFFDYSLKNNKLNWTGLSFKGKGSWSVFLGDTQKSYTTSEITFDLGIEEPLEKKKAQILLKGEFAISENTVIVFEAANKGQHLKAYINEGSSPSLKEILTALRGETAEPPEMMVKDFSFNLFDGKYAVQGDCHDYWPLYVGDTQQSLSEVFFIINKEPDKRSQLQIYGFVPVAGKEIYMNAVDVDAGKGWIFEGHSLEGDSIQLSEAVTKLFKPVGLSLTEGLPDFYIKNSTLRFEEKGRSCFLKGQCIGTWHLGVGNGSITIDNLMVDIKYENGKLLGTITGKTEFAGSRIDIVYDLTKDLPLNGSVTNLDTANFIYETCGGKVLELLPMPLGIKSMDFSQANILFDRKNEHIEIEGNGKEFSQSSLTVKKENAGFEACFAAITGNDWKFTSVSPYLNELDNMNFEKTLMVISSFTQQKFISHGISGDILPGINFITNLKLASAKETSYIQSILKLEEEYLPINCVISDLGQAQIYGKLEPLLHMGNSIELQDGILRMNVGEQGTECSISASFELKLFESIAFAGVLSVTENSAHYKGRIDERWLNPFQLEKSEIDNLTVSIDIDESQIPRAGFSGNIHIGDACGAAALLYNAQNPSQSVLNLKFNSIGMKDILGICSPSLLSSGHFQWDKVSKTALKAADLFIVPETTEIEQTQYKKGIWGSGILCANKYEVPVNIEIEPDQHIAVHAEQWSYFLRNESIYFSGDIGMACINVFNASVEETIAAYKEAERPAKDATVSIKELYAVEVQKAALKLKQGGYPAGQIAVGLTEAYKTTGENVTSILKQIGLTSEETAAAIKEAYDTAFMTLSQWLKNAGYTAQQAIAGLIAAYGLNAGEGAKCLKYAGYPSGEVALNIKNAYGSTVEAISTVLRDADYDSVTVTSFIRTAYGVKAKIIGTALRNAGYTGQEATSAIKFVYGWTAKATTKLLRSVGYTAEQLSAGLKYYYRLNASEAAAVLRFAGYTAGQVLFGLKNVYLQSVEKSASILKEVGYSANETAEGFKDSFNAEAVVTAVILKTVEYTVVEVACAMKTVYLLSLDDTTKVLRNAGYDSVLATEGLKAAYGVFENEIARAMRGAGYTSSEVAQGLKSVYSSVAATTAKALRYGGYTAEQTAEALKGVYGAENPDTAILLKGAGYTAVECAWGLKSAYAIPVELTGAALKGAGFTSEEVACGIKAAYEITLNESAVVLKAIGFDGKGTSAGIRTAYDALADETAGALWSAGYMAEETAEGLKLIYEETDMSAASTLKVTGYKVEEVAKGLKVTYESSTGRAAYCIKEAGYASEQACFGLKEAYLIQSDISLQALKEGGYSALQIAAALKGIYSETGEKVASLFKGIGYSAGQTGYSLRIVFGETVIGASTILKRVGYTANQTAAGLKTAYGSGISVIAELLKKSGYPAEEVAYYIRNVYSETAESTAAALKAAGYSCKEIAKGIRVAFSQSTDAASATLSITGYTIAEITAALMDSYEVSREIAAGALHAAGFNSITVLQAVKEVYGVSVQEAAVMLNNAEYFALEIAEALKAAYAVTPEDLTKIFGKSGQTLDEIAYSLKEVFALSDLEAISVIRSAGYSEDEAGRVAAIAYKLGPAEITKVLFGASYTVLQAGSYLNGVGRYSGEVTNASLLGANYNESEVREFMKAGFGWYTPIVIPSIELW